MKSNKTYKLDKSNKAEAFNPPKVKTAIFITVFCSVFVVVGIWGLIDFVVFRMCDWRYIEGFIVALVFAVIGSGAVVFSAINLSKEINRKKYEKKVIKKGDAVIAIISGYQCIEKETDYGDSKSRSYEVSFQYTFKNLDGEKITRLFKDSMDFRPELFEGSKIMLAIHNENVVILDKYSLSPKSKNEIDNVVTIEKQLSYKGLTKSELKIDRASVKYTAEFSHVRFWSGIALSVFCLIIFCSVAMPIILYIDVKIVMIIVFSILSIILIPLITLCVFLIAGGIKSRKKEKRVLQTCRFAEANVNIPTGVYSSRKQQHITFCFYDYKGNKRSHNITNATALRMIDRNACGVAAYTDTEAILLYDY